MAISKESIEQIVKMASELVAPAAAPFEASLGVDERCLSARKMVDILQNGAAEEDWGHLLQCPTCLENLTALGQTQLAAEPRLAALQIKEVIASKAAPAAPAPAPAAPARHPLPVVLGLENRTIQVGASGKEREPHEFGIRLIPTFQPDLIGKIDIGSLRLDGAVVAKKAEIIGPLDLNQDNTPKLLEIRFKDARFSPTIQDAVAHNRRVIDSVRLLGTFEGEKGEGFVGQATLEFFK